MNANILLWAGCLLGSLMCPANREAIIMIMWSTQKDESRVWIYLQKLRDLLTEMLQEAGRE